MNIRNSLQFLFFGALVTSVLHTTKRNFLYFDTVSVTLALVSVIHSKVELPVWVKNTIL